jgi:hypothetical protein
LAVQRCTEVLPRAAFAAVLLLVAADGRGYEEGAPPGHTGGFGEPDCTACHSDGEKNAPGGKLEIEGLPASYAPGKAYTLSIALRHPELASGGFQLAVRTAAGQPAGDLLPTSERTQVVADGGQSYLEHTGAGTEAGTDGRIQWEFEWLAPATQEQLVLNIAANAANDDISELGDFVYTLERLLSPVLASNALQDPVTGSSRKR